MNLRRTLWFSTGSDSVSMGNLAMSGDMFSPHYRRNDAIAIKKEGAKMVQNILQCTEQPFRMMNYSFG